MADENETKIRDAVGPNGTESPAKSPADVHGPSEAEMQAWADLLAAARRFDERGGTSDEFVAAIDKFVDARVDRALWDFAQRIEALLGVLP